MHKIHNNAENCDELNYSRVPEGEYEASLVNTGGAISDQYFCLGTLLPLKFEVELHCSQIFYDWYIC